MQVILKCILIITTCLLLKGETYVIDALKNANNHNNQGLYYLKTGYLLHAVEEFKIAILLNPKSKITATFYNNLGLSYLKLHKYTWAEESFEEALKINPNFFDYYINIVNVYKSQKVLNVKHLQFQQKKDKNIQDLILYSILNNETNHRDEAINIYKQLRTLYPELMLLNSLKSYLKGES